MVKRIFVTYLVVIIIFMMFFVNGSYAAKIPVTEENLKETFQKFLLSKENDKIYDIEVENNTVYISMDGESAYFLNYKLTNKPTFSLEIPINKGMSYEKFQAETENLILPIFGFVAVANIQGVEFGDASAYILLSILGNSLSGLLPSENSFIIVEDLEEGSTVEKTDNPNIIYESEFGDRVIEYVNKMYSEPQTISDNNEFNTFSMTIEKKDISDTSCKLVSTLSVNLDSDFSELVGYADKMENSLLGGEITEDNADYVITLKVGQKCKIQSNTKVTGYEFSGTDNVEFNKDFNEIIAKKAGITKGNLNIGEKKKSIYIIVEENLENKEVEPITLEINIIEDNKEDIKETVNLERLPNTGNYNIFVNLLYMIIGGCSLGVIALIYSLKKKK